MKLVSKDKEGRLKYCSDLFLFSLAQERHPDSQHKSTRSVKGIRVCWRWQGAFSDLEQVCALTSLQVLHSVAITRSLTGAHVRAGSAVAPPSSKAGSSPCLFLQCSPRWPPTSSWKLIRRQGLRISHFLTGASHAVN